jgi:Cft2 family RNA processing exonuclease
MVDQYGIALATRENAIIAIYHRPQIIIVTHAHENEIRALRGLARRQPVAAVILLAPLLGLGSRAVVNPSFISAMG